MPTQELELTDGRTVALELPPPGEVPSYFLISLPKAGSTLLNRIMRPLSAQLGAAFFSPANELHGMGVATQQVAAGLSDLFKPHGYAYGGFRGIDQGYDIPAFASGRTVFLVRDPRDMVTSQYFSEAYSHVPPGATASDLLLKQFEERRAKALAEPVDAYALRRAPDVARVFARTAKKLEGIDHKLYRYEDIVFAKRDWVVDMLTYLGLPIREPLIDRVVERNDVVPAAEDASAHIRRVAPGDHKDKLAPGTIARLDEIFAPVYAAYGYEASAA